MTQTGDFRYCPYCATPLVQSRLFDQVRPRCPACDYVHFLDPKVAVIGFVEHEERLLLIRRAINPARDRWALPGGYMDAGELPKAALRRELREEVGLDVRVGNLLDIFPMQSRDDQGNEASPGIVMVYAAQPLSDGLITLQSNDDVNAAGWFGPDEIPDELAFESTVTMLAAWQAARRAQ